MLGLDLVQLAQLYLALYNVYPTHIGERSEAAQAAMKHVISDLWYEVAAWDTVLPSPWWLQKLQLTL